GTAKSFSAVAYFFAREIHRKTNIPIGIVESAWPGTPIEDWIAPDGLRGSADLRSVTEDWGRATPDQKSFAENSQAFDLEFDDFELIPSDAAAGARTLANFDEGNSRLSTGGSFAYNWSDAPNAVFDLASPGHAG